MNRYTIHCTPEQTKKALELGALIKATFANIPNRCIYEGCYVEIPTAEQMIGWLEEQRDIEINVSQEYNHYIWRVWNGNTIIDESELEFCVSRPEATLAAIDAALEYLSNNKN